MNDNYPPTARRDAPPTSGLSNGEIRTIAESALALPGRWFAVETIEDVGMPESAGRYVAIRQFSGPPIGNFILTREDAGQNYEGLLLRLDNGRYDVPEDLGLFLTVAEAISAVGDRIEAILAEWRGQPV